MASGLIDRIVPSSAFALGVSRVVVHGTFLISVLIMSFSALGRLPVTIMRPTGAMKLLPWSFYDRLLTPSGMAVFKLAMVLSLLASTAGWLTPISTKTSFLFVLFYQGLVRSFGHFNHDEMLGVYCLAVLAFTPCGDQFSLDQRLRKIKRERPLFAYAYPILLMQLLMAWVYFSSALIKLRGSGLGYLSADNLPSLAIYHSLDNLHDTSFRLAFWLPQVRAYLPVVMAVVLLWELLFPLAVFFSRLRWLILGGGIAFHLSTLFFMNIFFPHQLALYLLFINWDAFRKSDSPPEEKKNLMPESKRRSLLCCLLAVLLVTAVVPSYAKKARRKKKPRKTPSSFLLAPSFSQPTRNYIPYVLTPPEKSVVNTRPARSAARVTRIPSVHILPVETIQAVNASQQIFSNSSPIDISAANSSSDPEPAVPYSSDIDVVGLTGVVTKVSVTLNGLTHSAPDDLDMLLVSPGGQTFHFWSDVGGDNPVSDITVMVSDDGDTPLPDSAALVDRTTYKPFNADTTGDDFPVPAIGPPYGEPAPAGAATFASVFNGLTGDQASGTWSLFITDDTDGNGGTIARGWSLSISTALPQTTAGQLVISEFRLSGPNGPDDEFIELYNTTGNRLVVQAADDSSGLGVAASDGVTRCTIPNGTAIPANGHYLCARAGASLSLEADNIYETSIADNAGLAVFNNSTGGESYSLANRIDAVGSSSEKNPLYVEGNGYPPLETNTLDYSLYRDLRPGGLPKDTNDNASDFIFVDTSGSNVGAGRRLGAPGPENLASPTQRNNDITATLMAPCLAATSDPNRVRDFTSDPENNSTLGTISVRRVFTNLTANDITRLRFRIIDITAGPAPEGTADVRMLSSTDSTGADPCNLGELVNIAGLTLETPPGQPLGGGFNSTLAAGVVNLETPLQAGASITVNFLLGVQQTGRFRFFVNVEALP